MSQADSIRAQSVIQLEEWDDLDGSCASPDSYSLHADSLPDAPHERSATLLEALIEMLPGRYMPLLDRLVIQVDDDETCISCADQVLFAAACELQAVIRDALLDLGLSDEIRICAPAPTQPTELCGATATHPGWIDAARWLMLEDDLCAALVGSALAPDGGLDVRAEAYEVICARFAAPVRDLLAAAQARASP